MDKAGIKEHILVIIATCNLVRSSRFLPDMLLMFLQPFCFVEHPAVHGFITYLNHTLCDDDIPKKSAIANAISAKVIQLEQITLQIIERIPLNISTIWNGWSSRRRHLFTLFSISYIDSPPGNDTKWELKNNLLKFSSPVGCHTRKLIGKYLVKTIQKFRVENKVSLALLRVTMVLIFL